MYNTIHSTDILARFAALVGFRKSAFVIGIFGFYDVTGQTKFQILIFIYVWVAFISLEPLNYHCYFLKRSKRFSNCSILMRI